MKKRRYFSRRVSLKAKLSGVVVLFLTILCILTGVFDHHPPPQITSSSTDTVEAQRPAASSADNVSTQQQRPKEYVSVLPTSSPVPEKFVPHIQYYFAHIHPLPFYGSLRDLRHSAFFNTKVLMMASDIFNKYYDFNFPPLSTENIFVEEYTDNASQEFMDELTVTSHSTLTAYATPQSTARPLVVFLAHKSLTEFQRKIELPEYATLRAELVATKMIIISEGTDEAASFVFLQSNSLAAFLEAPYLRMWFSQNCDIHHPKVRPLPIGTNHHFSEALNSYNRLELRRKVEEPYLLVQQTEAGHMITLLQNEQDGVLHGLHARDVPSKWRIIEECDTEMLEGTQRLSFDYRGAHLAPCLLKELGDRCEILLLAANIRSMSAQDRCGVMGRDRSHFEQITGLAGKPQLSVFLRSVDGRPHTVYLPLVDLYYIFMTSTLGHSRRKMRIFGSFGFYNNKQFRLQAKEDLVANGVSFFGQYTEKHQYRELLGEYAFTASPIGNGYDCHRTWEALLAGSIPIVNSPHLYTRQQTYNSTALADILADLPIFVVDSYRNITEDTLKAWAREAREKAARGEYKFEKLFSYHYMNEIRKLF